MRVPFEQLEAALAEALVPLGFVEERGALCARLFAETTRDGVYTHGLARFRGLRRWFAAERLWRAQKPSVCGLSARWSAGREIAGQEI